ncbi:MAG TPA: serine hydrolase domain-containing protein [Vicinamibacterales bacterium]|nr:serine hydrolase domain-containing protein [Vicinamibacterales bacterium]
MHRRRFLVESSLATLGLSTFALRGDSLAMQTPAIKEGFLESLLASWESGIPKWLQETRMPAVSIALIRDGRLAWRRAFGVKDTGTNEPVDVDSVFAACSDTKPVFAYGVMKLAERGVINLDTPLVKYTSRRVTADPRVELITARHVLTHTTGFPNWRQTPELPIQFTPGSQYQYSGEGFSYLQSVVVEITGKSFERFMLDNILVPLGMTSSSITWDMSSVRRIAKPHDEKGQRIAGKYVTPPSGAEAAEGIARYGAAAMLMTTPADYAKLLLEFLNPKPADTFRLNAASRAEMLRPQIKTGFGAEGLAWNLEEHAGVPRTFAHSGSDAGYYCFAAASVERRSGLMVMLNGDAYAPFLMKMLANPSGPPAAPQTLWLDFARRFFAA